MKKSTKLVAPDGGWGIFVCVGMAFSLTCIFATVPTFGLVYGGFLKSIGADTSTLTLILGASFSIQSFTGLFSNSLFKLFSIRSVGIFAGIIYFIGSFMQVFVKSAFELFVAYSLLQGIAAGLVLPTLFTTFNNYFAENSGLAMALVHTIVGIGVMIYPMFVHTLDLLYGFRGCVLMIAAFNSHIVLAMVLMHPVEWHMKKVVVNDCEINNEDRKKPLLNDSQSTLNLRMEENLSKRVKSLSHLNGTFYLSVSSVDMERQPIKIFFRNFVVSLLDYSLLKNRIFLNIILGMAFAFASDVVFSTLQPTYLFELNFTKLETANILVIGATTELISRVVLALTACFVKIASRSLFMAGAILSVLAKLALMHLAFNFPSMAIISGIVGLIRPLIHTTTSLVIAEYLPPEHFASGYGLYFFLQGNFMFLLGAIIGYIRDYTKDYLIAFHCLNLLTSLCIFPWLIEIIYVKLQRKKQTKIKAYNKSNEHE